MSTLANLLRPILVAPIQKEEGDLDSYLKALDKGKFVDKLCYGISDQKRGFYILDPVQQPGSLYCGGMGSGKSVSMRFTAATHMAANSQNTFYVFMDAAKGMNDYRMLFDNSVVDTSSGVAYGIDEVSKIVPLVDMVHAESLARKEEFSRVGATNIYDYDKKMRKINPNHKDIARIVIFIEEFHTIPNAACVKFSMLVDRPDSIAYKLKELMRVGRSYGIFFNFATQRATYDDVPGQLKPGISTMLCFKMNNPGDAAAMNLAHAQEISVEQRGRCAYEGGFIQFPYLSDDALAELLKKYYKPFNGTMLKYTPAQFRTALLEEGTSGMVKVKPLSEVIKNWNSFDFKDIVNRVLSIFGFTTEQQTNPAYLAELIAIKNGKRYAIKLAKENKDIGNSKIIEALKNGAKSLHVDGLFIFSGENVRVQSDNNYKVIDFDDLMQIGNIVDNKEKLEKEGTFREMYLRYPLADQSDFEETATEVEVTPAPVEVKKPVADLDKLIKQEMESEESEFEEYDYNYLVERDMLSDAEFIHKLLFDKNVKVKNLKEEKRQELITKFNIKKDSKFYNYFYLVNQGIHKDPVRLKPILEDEKVIITNIEPDQLKELKKLIEVKTISLEEARKENELLVKELSEVFPEEPAVKKEEKSSPLSELKTTIEAQKPKPIKPVINPESLAKLRERLKKDIEEQKK